MANAGFGLPLPYSIISNSGAPVRPVANILNDEPGLVVQYDGLANAATFFIYFDVTSSQDVSFFSMLGMNISTAITLRAYATDADRASNTGGITIYSGPSALSSNRSGLRKSLFTFTPTSRKYLRVDVQNTSGSTSSVSFWRMLVGKWISPADNIEVQAQAKIDDRQNRRYGQNGRRNFQNIGVWPAFTGKWPWISSTEYTTMIKPMMLKYGASRPVLFCLNYEDTAWGEDDLYYGDLEKDQAIDLDDGQLYSYQFSIVDIAPVVATL